MIVRSDLPRGIQAAMMVHAAGESSPGNLPPGTFAVVLAVHDEAALARVQEVLERKGVEFVAIHEPDEPYNGQLMALGLKPKLKGEVRRHVSSLPKYK